MLTKEELIEIKKRAENATPGPWSFDGDFTARINGMLEPVIYASYGELIVRDEDIDFITSAHTDITKLVAEVERLRAEIERLHEGLSYLTEYYQFDSPAQMAEVAEYYLDGGDNE